MKYIKLLIILLICSYANAEEYKYKVSDIPKDLKVGANSVVRVYDMDFVIESKSKAIETVKYAITILNNKARGLSQISEYYDDDTSLKIKSILIYDKLGKLIKKVKKKEIFDVASHPGYVLLGDSRMKTYYYQAQNYPYTIEYEYKKVHNSIVSYTTWYPISSYKTALESASLTIETPVGLNIRYKNNKFPSSVEIVKGDDKVSYSWHTDNLKAYKYEFLSPNYSSIFPNVIVAPTDFVCEGYDGNMSDWSSYGKWTYSLLEGRDLLDETTINEMKKIVAGVKDKREKIKKVYEYVQNKTRYVCISLGIGGFQPFPASDVDKNGYGDCKALSNYTKALLKVVGIESFYAEVGADDRRIRYKDFASISQTNHIILCVPMQKDSIWLECTSQDSPFNYLGDFTSDRYALLVKEDGGELVRTHQYTAKDNLKESLTNMELLKDGSLKCDVVSKYHSLRFGDIKGYFNISDKEKTEKLQKSLDIANYRIEDFDFKILNDGKYTCGERDLSLFLDKNIAVSNSRIFLPVNLINKHYYRFKKNKKRKQKIVEDECYTIKDSIVLKIPDSYVVENSPRVKDIKTKYGTYKTSIELGECEVKYVRTLTINKGEYAPEEFGDFYKFHKSIRKSENAKIVLLKSE